MLLLMPEVVVKDGLTASDYVDALGLTTNNRRWWLHTLDVHQLETFETGMDWLLREAPAPQAQGAEGSGLGLGSGSAVATAFAKLSSWF